MIVYPDSNSLGKQSHPRVSDSKESQHLKKVATEKSLNLVVLMISRIISNNCAPLVAIKMNFHTSGI